MNIIEIRELLLNPNKKKNIKVRELFIKEGQKVGFYGSEEYIEDLFKKISGINNYKGSINIFSNELEIAREKILTNMGIYFEELENIDIKLKKYLEMVASFYDDIDFPKIEDIMNKYRIMKLKNKSLIQMDKFYAKKSIFSATMLNDPDIFLIFNIFKNLKKESKDIILEIIEYELNDKTLIINSDNLEDLKKFCNLIYEIRQGELNVIYCNK